MGIMSSSRPVAHPKGLALDRLYRHVSGCEDCLLLSWQTGRLCPTGERLRESPWRPRPGRLPAGRGRTASATEGGHEEKVVSEANRTVGSQHEREQ